MTRIAYASVLSVTLLAGVATSCRPKQPVTRAGAGSEYLPLRFTSSEPQRTHYRFSVVPGGVRSQLELAMAMARDRVVARHYSGIDPTEVRPVVLERSREAYVSYRIGDAIYWTRHRVHLPKGEAVLTDGVQEVRARCGNRISDMPQLPVEYATTIRSLDDPESILVSTPRPASLFHPVSIDVFPAPEVRTLPRVIWIGEPHPPLAGLSAQPTPEPATFLLCLSGMGLLVFVKRKRGR